VRLVSPLKYGLKHIKRMGTSAFTDARPKDC
jgi:DMSO/TMAO reductase YedYZ molybdopterin-dependent catalytic subunit